MLDTSWFKLLVEFGVIGVASFFPFYLYALLAHSPDRLLSFACLAQFLLLGGFLNSFYAQFLYLPWSDGHALRQSQRNRATIGLDKWPATGSFRAGGA